MKTINILIPMRLRGQASQSRGYAMAVLLVAMSIMAVMLTVAMPVWRQATQREKEEELVFRGKQYAHAIGLFQRKYANAYPPNFDVLVNERFLRKKYKDPITNDDFSPILAGQNTGGTQPAGGRGAPGGGAAASQPVTTLSTNPQQPTNVGGRGGTATPGGPVGGIMGVTSKSKDQSIRLYNGRSHYNEWQFVYVAAVQAPGAGGAPGGTGQRGGQQGGSQFNPNGGPGPIGGQRGGRGGQGNGPGRGGPFGPGGPGGQPNRGGPGTFNPFQPTTPQQPITAPRGRG